MSPENPFADMQIPTPKEVFTLTTEEEAIARRMLCQIRSDLRTKYDLHELVFPVPEAKGRLREPIIQWILECIPEEWHVRIDPTDAPERFIRIRHTPFPN